MNRMARWAGMAVLAAMAAGTASAQMGMGMGQMPTMQGVFHPTVGTASTYSITSPDGQKREMQWGVVGKEAVNGQDGYWMEMVMDTEHGPMVIKHLMVPGSDQMTVRTIMQMAGRPPMEMPEQMMRARRQTPMADISKQGKLIGKESITVPAGTFNTEHWQSADGQTDAWVSADVSPMGLVKSTSKDGTSMVLTKVDKNFQDKITGTPVPFNPMGMMGGMRGQPPQQPPPQQ